MAEAVVEPLEDISDLNGRQIGNYVIERPLARGGMAVVYLARHPGLGREVAVKLLSPEYQGDAELNARFLQEARVTATFHHPHIVEIYDLGETEGRAYYTMERLVGVDLAGQLLKHGRFSPGEVAQYLTQICDALDAAHQCGVVHRDLKPGNIFVVDEQPLCLKLMDFGIAKVKEARRPTGTRRGEVLGTPAYMAPEQALGNVDAISVTTDIYALGIILYEMLTGRLPFHADSDLMLLTMHIRDAPPPMAELVPTLPPALIELVERCLAKDPGERPGSAWELALEFERLSQSESEPLAPQPAPPEPVAPPPAASVARRVGTAARAARAPDVEPEPRPAKPASGDVPAPEPVVIDPGLLLSEVTDEPGLKGPIRLSAEDGQVLDKLLRRMQRRADFPSFLNNVTEISRKADADAAYSARQLSESILKDYALTAKLLRMVNNMFASRFAGKVYSINQAVLILGFDSVRSMALSVSVFKQSSQKAATGAKANAKQGRFHDELADEAINSLISGEIARILAPRAGVKDTELASMCAMFRNLGQQLVMEYLPDEHHKLVQLAATERISRAQAAQRVLGMTLPRVGLGVAERWCLPVLMRGAMSSNPKSDTPLVREEDRLGALAKLSNDLCHIVATGDRASYKQTMTRLLALHKNLLTLHDQDVSSLLGIVCKSFETRYSALFGPYHRKSRFLFNARGITGEPAPSERRESPPITDNERARLAAAVQALSDGLQRKLPPDALLGDALGALARALDAARVVLMTTSSDRKELTVRLAVGEDAKPLKSQLRLPVTHGADVFSVALRSGKNVVIPDALGPAAMRRVPQRYFEAIGSTAFALYVCASRGYPTALVLVDADSAETLPSSQRVLLTKELRELVAKIAERH
jgi:serine/threonine protein kinase/HD-like signal output (HDOD) protein